MMASNGHFCFLLVGGECVFGAAARAVVFRVRASVESESASAAASARPAPVPVCPLTLTQMPQPMHSSSEIHATLLVGATSMHSLPTLTTGHDFLHCCCGEGEGGGEERERESVLMFVSQRGAAAGSSQRAAIRPTERPDRPSDRPIRFAGPIGAREPRDASKHRDAALSAVLLTSCLHFLGLQRSSLTIAMRVRTSSF